MEPIIERLKKVRVLMERGESGEAQAAAHLLFKQLEKHGLTLTDLDVVETRDYEYRYFGTDHKRLVMQCWIVVTDDAYANYKSTRGKRVLFLEMTPMQKAMMDDLLTFHKNLYYREKQKAVDKLMTAYIHKHHIFAENEKDTDDDQPSKYSLADLAEIGAMMGGMDNKSYLKRIKQNNHDTQKKS